MTTLEQAISKLRNHGINPTQEVLETLEERKVVAILVYWSSITRLAGYTRINEIIGDGYLTQWLGNSSEYRITLKNK